MRARPYLVWAAALAAYVVAVAQRSSLGVAGLAATERFDLAGTGLALFSVVQLTVYAAGQVPAGMLLDRVGSRLLIATGGLAMAAGQFLLALAPSFELAIVGRVLLGAGDAATFISVVRLIPSWFPPDRAPVFTQITGVVGQLGQIVAAIPFLWSLHAFGWTSAFTSLAAVGVLVSIGVLAAVRDRPAGTRPPTRMRFIPLRTALAVPGTRLGFWTHFVCPFFGNTFLLLWGYPFLVEAQGLEPGAVSGLFTLNVLASIVLGPVIGWLTGRFPIHRSRLVLTVAVATASAWTLLLAIPGRVPGPLLVLVMIVLAVGSPGSLVGFDFARTFNRPTELGTATGLVNAGGFLATIASVLIVGVALGPAASLGTAASYRIAFAAVGVVWVVGIIGFLVTRRRVRATGGLV